MRYTVSNTINASLEDVAAKFQDPKGVLVWMEGLQKVVHLSGKPGEVGAKSEFHFVHKGKEMMMTETILENDMPNQIKFSYESKMGYNDVEMRFEKLSESSVKQINTSFFDLKGVMKVMGFLFKGMFKKQTMKFLVGFKKYVEG